jgi:hypothetical protein
MLAASTTPATASFVFLIIIWSFCDERKFGMPHCIHHRFWQANHKSTLQLMVNAKIGIFQILI